MVDDNAIFRAAAFHRPSPPAQDMSGQQHGGRLVSHDMRLVLSKAPCPTPSGDHGKIEQITDQSNVVASMDPTIVGFELDDAIFDHG
jgi:hypothetical protein